MAAEVGVVFNHFPQTAAALRRAVLKAVDTTADSIAQDAASQAPVDTGFLAASIYFVSDRKSTYGTGRASDFGTPNVAKALYQELFPEQVPPDDVTALVAVGATYGAYLEYGTRFMSAQPYFYQAVDNGQAVLEDKLSLVSEDLVGIVL